MKKKILFLLLLIFLFAAFLGIRFFLMDRQNANGRLKIVSTPAASVFIDNVPIGKTPYEEKQREGEFIIKLIPEKGEGDAQISSWQGKVKINKNTLTYVNRELGGNDLTSAGEIFTVVKMAEKPKNKNYGEIYVESEPSGAIVYLNNDEKGVTPLILQEVLKGDHELSIYMPGFLRRTQKINVDGSYRVNAGFKLALDPTQKTLDQTLNETRKKEATKSAALKEATASAQIVIGETPTGWLRVRSEPSISATEIGRVNAGEKYPLIEEQINWYKIKLETLEGWISAEYATKDE